MRLSGILIMSLLLSSCAQWFPHTYRFRMIVEVNTPQGVKTGASVYEISATNFTQILSDQSARGRWVKGEAVSVELPNGQILFALLKTGAHLGDMATLSMATLYPKYSTETYDFVEVADKIEDRDDDVLKRAVVQPKRIKESYRNGEKIREYISNYPMLVTFDDIKDSASVKQVDPDDLASSFGTGYAIKRIIIELTDDPVTTGIEKKLRWWASNKGSMVEITKDRNMSNMLPAELLGKHDFKRGIEE